MMIVGPYVQEYGCRDVRVGILGQNRHDSIRGPDYNCVFLKICAFISTLGVGYRYAVYTISLRLFACLCDIIRLSKNLVSLCSRSLALSFSLL